jgi:ribonucleoside-triphosphate reductase
MKTLEMIDAEIQKTQQELAEVRGTETEVYTRIVGYYRSLRNWNKGKREEYNHRLCFSPDGDAPEAAVADPAAKVEGSASQGLLFSEGPREHIAAYNYFYRKTCPNCPPVQDFISKLPFEGNKIDVDTEDGLSRALNYQVMSTPTVVFFDREGKPLHQMHSVDQMAHLFADSSGE